LGTAISADSRLRAGNAAAICRQDRSPRGCRQVVPHDLMQGSFVQHPLFQGFGDTRMFPCKMHRQRPFRQRVRSIFAAQCIHQVQQTILTSHKAGIHLLTERFHCVIVRLRTAPALFVLQKQYLPSAIRCKSVDS
jgi:hypothetical protein